MTEKTPEEAARSKRAHADSMIAMGAVTTVCALAAAWIAISGRGDVPDWMFGGRRAERAAVGDWANRPSAVRFEAFGLPALERARREKKLVLLFLGPGYNAPTARMEAETFGDPRVAALANERFVPVKVLSDERPDLDRRYRSNGWPTTAVLLPDGVPLAAGTSMTPDVFLRWAGALADKANAHPEILARVDAEASERRRAEPLESGAPMSAAEAERRAQAALFATWDPARRTFDRVGPRFPRFERIAALRSLKADWARELAVEASKGALALEDPAFGGFRRAANPDGTPAALETTASDQAGALDVLCGSMPVAARRELTFLSANYKTAKSAWRGWQAGYALTPDLSRATNASLEGTRPAGRARLGDGARLSCAVLSCREAPPALQAYARRNVDQAWKDFVAMTAAKGPVTPFLDEASELGDALIAAGRPTDAEAVWRWIDANLSDGPAFWDRLATAVLASDLDRVADPALNARALAFLQRLPPHGGIPSRRRALYAWLSSRTDSIDPAVWAALAAEEEKTR